MTTRKFHFPLSELLGSSRRLHDALVDADYVTAMGNRLNGESDTRNDNFQTRFNAKISAVSTGDANQKTQAGDAGTLTRGQDTDFAEMERLVAGARRSARLAFPGDHVKLHSQFQVGIREPATLEAELERAGIILASCKNAENAPALKIQGWTDADTAALEAVIGQFSSSTLAQDAAIDDRIGLTGQKVVAANAVYADALRIQNAARLEYPANKPGTEAARARFLLDVFPPRDRSEPSGGAQVPHPTPTTTPTPTSPSGSTTPAGS